MICENCNQEHDGSYGSGRFCCQKCARAFSTKNKRKEINQKVSNTFKAKANYRYCIKCGKIIRKYNKSGYCSDCFKYSNECKELRYNIGKIASSHIKHYREKIDPVYNDDFQPHINKINYLYLEHNNNEIQKWINYISSISLNIPKYEVRQSQYYYVLKENCTRHKNTTHYIFEHNFLMSLLIDLQPQNTVHHIDNNGLNNSLDNLLVFETNAEHKRFHKSKYAWLTYNEDSHKFNCILKK